MRRYVDWWQRLASVESVLLCRRIRLSFCSTNVDRWRRWPMVETTLLIRRQRTVHHHVSTHGGSDLDVAEACRTGSSAVNRRLNAEVAHHRQVAGCWRKTFGDVRRRQSRGARGVEERTGRRPETATATLVTTVLVDCSMLTSRVQRRRSWLANATRLIAIVRVLFLMSSFLFLNLGLATVRRTNQSC
jgi:hypothetical protein